LSDDIKSKAVPLWGTDAKSLTFGEKELKIFVVLHRKAEIKRCKYHFFFQTKKIKKCILS
jgi:hypothetical protein